MGLFDFLTETIGVDPGSQNLRILKNNELHFNDTSKLSYETTTGIPKEIGESIIQTPNETILRPVNYVIGDFFGFEELLKRAIRRGLNQKGIFQNSLRIYFSTPSSLTQVEQRAYRDSGEHAGAKEVLMIHQCCCSAIGMDILFQKKDFILIDFSSSKIEVSIFADSIPISIRTFRLGVWRIIRLIKNYINRNYSMNITDADAEQILIKNKDQKAISDFEIKGQIIKANEIQTVINCYFSLANEHLIEALEEVKIHSNINKIFANGIYFTGGGSLNQYLLNQIQITENIKSEVSQNPLLDNINGLKAIIGDPTKFEYYIAK